MDTRSILTLGAGTALGLVIAGTGIILLQDSGTMPVNIVQGTIVLDTPEAATMISHISRGEVTGPMRCFYGKDKTSPDKLWCTDYQGVSFLVDPETTSKLIADIEASATGKGFPGIVADEISVEQTGNRLTVGIEGVIEQ